MNTRKPKAAAKTSKSLKVKTTVRAGISYPTLLRTKISYPTL